MPTPPFNHPSAIEAFAPMIARYKGEVVQDLTAAKRFRNKAALKKTRDLRKCEIPFCKNWRFGFLSPLDPHHIIHRAAGGADDFDFNLIGVCRKCHTRIHNGELSKELLQFLVAERKQ